MKIQLTLTAFLIALLMASCESNSTEKSEVQDLSIEQKKHLVDDYAPLTEDGFVNAVIEIPAGTVEKWEVDKASGDLKLEHIDGKPRIINYLGYPANYGMIPRTYLPKELGGDGDPLDVLVLGKPLERGSTVACKIIGVLVLLDRGEQDDKLIAVQKGSKLSHINDIKTLKSEYKGTTEIIKTWFDNYKGPNKMEAKGFGNREQAMEILNTSIAAYDKK
ncbi:MAG: inorganic pyrophosphatase [Salibacteraceae bacterium]